MSDAELSEIDEQIADEVDAEGKTRLRSTAETLRPIVAKHARNGTLSAFAGAVTIARGISNLPRNRRRALLQLVVGSVWIAVAMVQRRASEADEATEETEGETTEEASIDGEEDAAVGGTEPVDGLGMSGDEIGADVTPEVDLEDAKRGEGSEVGRNDTEFDEETVETGSESEGRSSEATEGPGGPGERSHESKESGDDALDRDSGTEVADDENRDATDPETFTEREAEAGEDDPDVSSEAAQQEPPGGPEPPDDEAGDVPESKLADEPAEAVDPSSADAEPAQTDEAEPGVDESDASAGTDVGSDVIGEERADSTDEVESGEELRETTGEPDDETIDADEVDTTDADEDDTTDADEDDTADIDEEREDASGDPHRDAR